MSSLHYCWEAPLRWSVDYSGFQGRVEPYRQWIVKWDENQKRESVGKHSERVIHSPTPTCMTMLISVRRSEAFLTAIRINSSDEALQLVLAAWCI